MFLNDKKDTTIVCNSLDGLQGYSAEERKIIPNNHVLCVLTDTSKRQNYYGRESTTAAEG